MISIDRNSIEKPKFFTSKDYEEQINSLKEFYLNSERSQKRFLDYSLPFDIVYALESLFNNKCAYCEAPVYIQNENALKTKYQSTMKFSSFDGIDHFRPRENAKNLVLDKTIKTNNAIDLEHYWWLSYEWNNLYYCCQDCKKYKASWFPVKDKRVNLETDYKSIIDSEKNLFLDPCNDTIEIHLSFDISNGKIMSNSEKGEITIELLNLNRSNLVSDRINAIKEEQKIFSSASKFFDKNPIKSLDPKLIEHWSSLLNGDSKLDYIAFRRQVILNFIKNNPLLKSTFNAILPMHTKWLDQEEVEEIKIETSNIQPNKKTAKKKKEKIDITHLSSIYLEKIELKNYKCFDALTIQFLDNKIFVENEPWLVFLGENGVGKSSVLKAIAVALIGQKQIDQLDIKAAKFLQYDKRVGYIKLHIKHKDKPIVVTFNKGEKIISNIQEPSSYIIGYGSTRLLPKGSLQPEQNVNYVKVLNLFDYSIALSDAESWLLDVSTTMFNQVAKSLKDLLLLDNNDDFIKRNKSKNELYIKSEKNNTRTNVSDLSDGYKTIFAITVDLIKTLSKDNLAFETAEGIVLIDEIGTHLHPRWKMEVVKRLRKTFPKLQFIATTHEPLCLRGLDTNEVIVLKKNNEDKIIAITDLPSPNEFRVDQLLTSEYFGLNSTMDFETEDLFKEYYALIVKEDNEITKKEKERRDELSEILPNKKHLGDDIRDELVYYVIDQLLAKQVSDDGYKIIDNQIKKEALSKVASIWKHIAKNDTSL